MKEINRHWNLLSRKIVILAFVRMGIQVGGVSSLLIDRINTVEINIKTVNTKINIKTNRVKIKTKRVNTNIKT